MKKYEYQILESDSPIVPADMLNQQGENGWMLNTIMPRETTEGAKRWLFYFNREVLTEELKRGVGAVIEEE
jgi:hypothetical protein